MRAALLLGLLLAVPAMAQDHDHHGEPPVHSPPCLQGGAGGGCSPTTTGPGRKGTHPQPLPPEGGESYRQPTTTAPKPPADHAADRYYDPTAMAAARVALFREHGAMRLSQVMIDLAELRPGKHRTGYAWNGEAWIGGDIDRFMIKSEGEGGARLDHAEVQALWSHALDPYWNLQLGARQDIRPRPGRTYAVLAVEGLAPWWFEVEASLFLSNKGDVSARIEAWHDMRITQRLILQPRIEANFAASDDRATGTGSGLTDAELGLRLRTEISRQFAPYVGIIHGRKFGDTGRFAAAAGEEKRETRAVIGLRAWF